MSRPVAFVTGGAGGIGSATVLELSHRGYAVAVTDFGNADNAAVLAGEIGGIAIDVDVADPVAIAGAVKETEKELGPVGVAVCCAGIDIDRTLELTDDSLWNRFLHVLLGGCVNVIGAVRPGMEDRATGSIVTVSSELALIGEDRHVAYVAAKAAILGLTRAMAFELGPSGIRVNSVAPGPTDTTMLTERWREDEAYLASIPLGRFGQPGEVAATIVDLAEATWTTGQIVSPNGGIVIQ
jgi:NAD(P)-dependent dehydrogenase (short-subunit alcohol dehydrogenase family)